MNIVHHTYTNKMDVLKDLTTQFWKKLKVCIYMQTAQNHFETAIHTYNHTPLKRTNWKSPYENLYGKKPDIKYFRTFGCLAWVFIPKQTCQNKHAPRSEKMISLRYEEGSKAYKFMRNNTIFISDNAIFDETIFQGETKLLQVNLLKVHQVLLIVKMKDPHTIITIKIVILHMMMIDMIHCMMMMVWRERGGICSSYRRKYWLWRVTQSRATQNSS